MTDDPFVTRPFGRRESTGRGTRLWLVRHAQVHADWHGRAYGDLDVPLSERGLARTEELAQELAELAPDRLISSSLERARRLGSRTAELCGRELALTEELREIHRGSWQGQLVSQLYADAARDVEEFYADPWTWRGHGGECDAMVAQRSWGALEGELAATGPGTLVVTTHYNVIRVLASTALGIPPRRSFAFRVDPGRAALLVDAERGWSLRHANVHSPIEAMAELL